MFTVLCRSTFMHLRLMFVPALLGLLAGALSSADALAAPTLQVVVVRHAEKSAEPAADPGLSEQGKRRALALAAALRHAGIRRIVVSGYARTGETAAPLAALLDIVPLVADTGSDIDAHVRGVVESVRGATGPVLVVGHSNTVPAIIQGLGGPEVAPIAEDEFNRLYVLGGIDGSPHLVQGRYGD
jgi:broad specificity phosphatase PhoE